jgi:hypothetical protein
MNKLTFEVVLSDFGNIIKKVDADGKEWWIPTDPANSDYQAYLDQLKDSEVEIQAE